MKKPRHATCNPKVITALTEDYKALMLRRLMIQGDNINPSSCMYRIASCALTELGVTRPHRMAKLERMGRTGFGLNFYRNEGPSYHSFLNFGGRERQNFDSVE